MTGAPQLGHMRARIWVVYALLVMETLRARARLRTTWRLGVWRMPRLRERNGFVIL
jgi:hypothetical protein